MKHDWEYKKLGDICDKGSSNISLNKIKDNIGEYALFGASGYVKDIDFYHNETPYIGIVKDGSGCGRVNIYPAKSSLVGTMQYIYPKQNCDIKFLMYLLQSLDLSSLVTGAAIPHIYFKDYSKFSVPLPPLSTQQSIVSELDSLSQIIADCKETLKDYDALEQSIFYDMFGDPVKNDKGWEVKKLEDLCDKIVDCPHSTPIKSETPTRFPCIRTSELRNGEISWDSMQYVGEKEYENRIARLQPQTDDIVFGREGSIGGAVILPEGYNFCLGQRTMLLRANRTLIEPVFLHRVILSDWIKNQIMDKNVASTVAHVNVKDVKAFLLPLPPLSLQQQFASKIEAIEQMKSETKKALQEAETLFQARMDYWFG